MKRVRVRFTELHSPNALKEDVDYITTGYVSSDDEYNYVEFKEDCKENGYYLRCNLKYNDKELYVIRKSENEEVHIEISFPINGKGIGFYEVKENPELNVSLKGKIYEYSYNDHVIKFSYELYIKGTYMGKYRAVLTLEELK